MIGVQSGQWTGCRSGVGKRVRFGDVAYSSSHFERVWIREHETGRIVSVDHSVADPLATGS